MHPDYSTVTIQLPAGYFVTHLQQMGALTEQFPGLKIVQGLVTEVQVVGSTAEAQEVTAWMREALWPLA